MEMTIRRNLRLERAGVCFPSLTNESERGKNLAKKLLRHEIKFCHNQYCEAYSK